jgi:hypothetical protein
MGCQRCLGQTDPSLAALDNLASKGARMAEIEIKSWLSLG